MFVLSQNAGSKEGAGAEEGGGRVQEVFFDNFDLSFSNCTCTSFAKRPPRHFGQRLLIQNACVGSNITAPGRVPSAGISARIDIGWSKTARRVCPSMPPVVVPGAPPRCMKDRGDVPIFTLVAVQATIEPPIFLESTLAGSPLDCVTESHSWAVSQGEPPDVPKGVFVPHANPGESPRSPSPCRRGGGCFYKYSRRGSPGYGKTTDIARVNSRRVSIGLCVTTPFCGGVEGGIPQICW